jgi:chromosome segregation ATPase
VLYLAEVQKKSGGLLGGGGKAELRLLACQRSEQNWSSVSGDEVIPSDEANSYGSGALVLVDLSANRQVQRLQEAGRPLVSILQNFSRLQEKFKTQEEEIEQWKQSLTYQSQELNRREMEMEARREQLQQMEEDFEQMEQQRQEITALQEEINQQKEAYERNRQELEGAWDHLRGETRRMEEQQATMQQSTVLDEDKARTLNEVLNRLTGISPVEPVRESLNASFEILSQHQERLNQYWQTLEQQRSQINQSNHEIEQQAQTIRDRWQEWHQAQTALEQAKAELRSQQSALIGKQDYVRLLSSQLHSHDELHQQVYRLAATSDHVKIGFHVDVAALETMSIDDLQKVVQDLENELLKLESFVESQEEELRSKQQEIDEIKAKIEAANEYDRLNLENEMSDEQDGYQMLYETLVGQRRSLQERKAFLNQHQSILRRRQGLADPEGSSETVIDLEPILTQIDAQRQQQADELQALEAQITQMQAAIQQTENMVNNQVTEQDAKRIELERLDDELLKRRKADSEVIGKVAIYQEMLQPVQDTTDGMRQKLDAIAGSMAQGQEAVDSQQQAITEIRQVISSLTNS